MTDTAPAQAPETEDDPSIAQLIARLIDSGEAFVRAELALYRLEATVRVERARLPLIGFVTAAALALAAVAVALVAVAELLVPVAGRAGGFALAALIGLALAGLTAWLAWRGLARAVAADSGKLANDK